MMTMIDTAADPGGEVGSSLDGDHLLELSGRVGLGEVVGSTNVLALDEDVGDSSLARLCWNDPGSMASVYARPDVAVDHGGIQELTSSAR
jgi:hypothetical protein